MFRWSNLSVVRFRFTCSCKHGQRDLWIRCLDVRSCQLCLSPYIAPGAMRGMDRGASFWLLTFTPPALLGLGDGRRPGEIVTSGLDPVTASFFRQQLFVYVLSSISGKLRLFLTVYKPPPASEQFILYRRHCHCEEWSFQAKITNVASRIRRRFVSVRDVVHLVSTGDLYFFFSKTWHGHKSNLWPLVLQLTESRSSSYIVVESGLEYDSCCRWEDQTQGALWIGRLCVGPGKGASWSR